MDQFDRYNQLRKIADAGAVTKPQIREAMAAAALQINELDPWSGYYQLAQYPNGPLEPLGVWREGDQLVVVWGSIIWQGDEARIEKFWPQCVWRSVPYDWYEGKVDRGEEWPNLHQLAEPQEAERPGPREAVLGDNSGATPEEIKLLGEVHEAKRGVAQYVKITSDEQLAASQTLRSDLLTLARRAKTCRETR